jgi:hypothetical protein
MAGASPMDDERSRLIDLRDGIADRRRVLAHRLDDGYRRIDEALRDGADVDAWEEFWIRLLQEYEEVCDELKLAA